jgi:hypothetical protein
LPTLQYGDGPVTLSATASSGLRVLFEVVSGPVSIAGEVLTIHGAGAVSLQAVQAGDHSYLPAVRVEEFHIRKAAQEITFNPVETIFAGSPVSLTATATSGLPVTLSLVDGEADLRDALLSAKGPGIITIEATQTGDGNFEPAAILRRSITVLAPPRLSVRREAANVTVAWPKELPACKLQMCNSLDEAWRDLDSVDVLDSEITIKSSEKIQLFRLRFAPDR